MNNSEYQITAVFEFHWKYFFKCYKNFKVSIFSGHCKLYPLLLFKLEIKKKKFRMNIASLCYLAIQSNMNLNV